MEERTLHKRTRANAPTPGNARKRARAHTRAQTHNRLGAGLFSAVGGPTLAIVFPFAALARGFFAFFGYPKKDQDKKTEEFFGEFVVFWETFRAPLK